MGAKIDFKEIENISHGLSKECMIFFIIINISMAMSISIIMIIHIFNSLNFV